MLIDTVVLLNTIKDVAINCMIFFFKDVIYLFSERGGRKEKEGKKHQWVASCVPPTGDMACNPGMCPDWESNRWPFGLQAHTQSKEPHQPRQLYDFFKW